MSSWWFLVTINKFRLLCLGQIWAALKYSFLLVLKTVLNQLFQWIFLSFMTYSAFDDMVCWNAWKSYFRTQLLGVFQEKKKNQPKILLAIFMLCSSFCFIDRKLRLKRLKKIICKVAFYGNTQFLSKIA